MRIFCFLLLLFLLVIVSAEGAESRQSRVRLQSVTADFIQEKHLKVLVAPLISRGTFTYQSPDSLRWQYTTPVPSLLLMHGGKVRKFVHRNGVLKEEKGGNFDFMQVVMSEIGNWLDGRFEANELFEVSFPDELKIHLQPKSEALSRLISRIELTLADKQGLLDAVKIVENPNSYTRITFFKRRLNTAIPPSTFLEQ